MGGVTPSPLLFNRSDDIGVGVPSLGAVPPPAALLRWLAELVRNGSTGLTGPVVGDDRPPAEGLDARETGLMVLGLGCVLPLPPLFSKSDGTRDGTPTVGDEVVLVVLVLGAVGKVLLGTEPGLRAACIAGFSFPGFSVVGAGAGDGVVDGSGEFTGVEASLVGFTGELVGNVIREGFVTDELFGAFTGLEANWGDFPGELLGNVNFEGFATGELLGNVNFEGFVTGAFTGEFTGRFPRGLGTGAGAGAGVKVGAEGDGAG
ncbi:hypothetical protein ACWD4J_35900 [Streptomyces sp. NPDC002577]